MLTLVWDICGLPCGCEPVAIRNEVCVHCKGQLVMLVPAISMPKSEEGSLSRDSCVDTLHKKT